MDEKFVKKEGDATKALFMSGIQTFNTGMRINDRGLLELSHKQLELAAKEGSLMAEFFRQIIIVRLAERPEGIDLRKMSTVLNEILYDPDLERFFLNFLSSYKETLEFANNAKLIKLHAVAENCEGSMDEILILLKEISIGQLHNLDEQLSKLHLLIGKFLNRISLPDQTSK